MKYCFSLILFLFSQGYGGHDGNMPQCVTQSGGSISVECRLNQRRDLSNIRLYVVYEGPKPRKTVFMLMKGREDPKHQSPYFVGRVHCTAQNKRKVDIIISNATEHDSGVYRCIIDEEASGVINITVKGQQLALSGSTTTTCRIPTGTVSTSTVSTSTVTASTVPEGNTGMWTALGLVSVMAVILICFLALVLRRRDDFGCRIKWRGQKVPAEDQEGGRGNAEQEAAQEHLFPLLI